MILRTCKIVGKRACGPRPFRACEVRPRESLKRRFRPGRRNRRPGGRARSLLELLLHGSRAGALDVGRGQDDAGGSESIEHDEPRSVAPLHRLAAEHAADRCRARTRLARNCVYELRSQGFVQGHAAALPSFSPASNVRRSPLRLVTSITTALRPLASETTM